VRALLSLRQFGLTTARPGFHRYCATRGLLFSHVGWIFFKPNYAKLHLIEREDLEQDPGAFGSVDAAWDGRDARCRSADRESCLVVRWQHRHFGAS
jgi:hypothetical protein